MLEVNLMPGKVLIGLGRSEDEQHETFVLLVT
jgi:hypothetical protein